MVWRKCRYISDDEADGFVGRDLFGSVNNKIHSPISTKRRRNSRVS